MRQKVTWIIPGILVTLLLGLLWAMPAFAADAGNIEFLDSDGDEVTHLSLKGLGGTGDAVMLQITDQDLNEPVKDVILQGAIADNTLDWSNLADANEDGLINFKDLKWYYIEVGDPDGTPPTEDVTHYQDTEAGQINLNLSGGSLGLAIGVTAPNVTYTNRAGATGQTALATGLEYMILKETSISGRAATQMSSADAGEPAAGREGQTASTVTVPTDAPWAWSDLGDTDGNGKVNAADVTARNADAPASEVDLTVTIDGDRDDDGDGNENTPSVNGVNPNDAATTVADQNWINITDISVADTDDPDGTGPMTAATVGRVTRLTPATDDPEDTTEVVDSNVTLTYSIKVSLVGEPDEKGNVANRVKVSSDAFGAGIYVVLSESTATSGKFQVMLNLCDDALNTDENEDGTPNMSTSCTAMQEPATGENANQDGSGTGAVTIPVNNAGDTIRVTYSDSDPSRTRTASIPLDVSGPSFSNLAPATGTSGREDEPTVSFDVQDTDSGISDDKDAEGSVMVLAGIYGIGDDGKTGNEVIYYRDDLKLEEATNGYSASVTIEEGLADDELNADPLGDEYEIRWWAVSTDLAGNDGVSDSDGDTKCNVPATVTVDTLEGTIVPAVNKPGEDGYVAGTGCDPFVVRVDTAGPELDATQTFTGSWLDGSEEKSGPDGKRTSIVVAFNEALDCDSVSADDFEVDGSAPNGVTCKGSNVYLDVDELDPNDRPEITVAEESLTDKAGNLIGADEEITSNDGIPAKLTVSVSGTGEGDRVVTDEDITITISSDERLAGNPKVTISKVGDDYVLVSDPVATSAPTGTANEWILKPVFSGNDDDGLWSVYVSGNDLGSGALKLEASAGTSGTEGTKKDADGKDVGNDEFTIDLDSKSAILFEVDNEVQPPAWSPDIVDNDFKTDNANVFIRADFSDEGKEYGLDGVDADATPVDDTRKETDTPGDVVTDFDTHATVTLVSASFNGDDVTEDVNTRDWIRYAYRPGGLTNGDHVFKIEVMDSAGNEKEFTLEFAKTDPAPYTLEIDPGPNLISFPANPADGDINAVFGGEGNEDISNVLTYDNASGLWMSALKGEDGMFVGDLTTIDAMHGYWVLSDGVLDVSVVLEGSERFDRTPPHLAVQEGWNLVSVVDADRSKAGTGIPTNEYFANIDAQVVYGFDSLAGRLVRLSTAKADATKDEVQDMVETGSAYWVYANEAGIIIP